MALSETVKKSVYLNRFLTELGFYKLGKVDLFCDNQGAAKLAHNLNFHDWSKYIDIR